jgi:alkanesulfonate monooxygenase SsuD/methylene tetrahydromethanopterin reductase-like flavin-dependent oxidoreductase (luciferase family)
LCAVLEVWVSLPWAGPAACYGADSAALAVRLESLGVTGVVQGDHLFVPGPPPDGPVARMAADSLTVLTTVAAHSSRLSVATLVANVGLQHPIHLLRRFANLALLYGGERVYAGLGAGWSAREFEALGMTMPPHRERLARLTETAQLARELFDEGWASVAGEHVVARDLPLAPAPPDPPRLLLGGGSPALLELAARYADHVDLAPPTHRRGDALQRPLLTTVDDLADSARLARAGPRRLTTSVLMSAVVVCEPSRVRAEEEAVCARVGLPWRPLGDCPYVLVGEPARLAERVRERRERIGLDRLIVPYAAIEPFTAEVLPLA